MKYAITCLAVGLCIVVAAFAGALMA